MLVRVKSSGVSAPVLEPLEGVCVPPGRPHPISLLSCTWSRGAGELGNLWEQRSKAGKGWSGQYPHYPLPTSHSIHWAPTDNNGEFVITDKISS